MMYITDSLYKHVVLNFSSSKKLQIPIRYSQNCCNRKNFGQCRFPVTSSSVKTFISITLIYFLIHFPYSLFSLSILRIELTSSSPIKYHFHQLKLGLGRSTRNNFLKRRRSLAIILGLSLGLGRCPNCRIAPKP